MRKVFANTLIKLAEKDPKICFLTPDMGYSIIDDFQIKSKAGKAVIEMLTKFGCFEGMSKSNQISLFG